MVIGGDRRLDFDVRENTKLRVLWQRGSIPFADVSPEVEEKARAALQGTAEVTVLAQIDIRVENSREYPAVLEKVICGGMRSSGRIELLQIRLRFRREG
jgi:hypothetical protein